MTEPNEIKSTYYVENSTGRPIFSVSKTISYSQDPVISVKFADELAASYVDYISAVGLADILLQLSAKEELR